MSQNQSLSFSRIASFWPDALGCVIGLGFSGLLYGTMCPSLQQDALERKFADIDTQVTHVFNSMAACNAQGLSASFCSTSYANARAVDVYPAYETPQACQERHETCMEMYYSYVGVGNPMITLVKYVPIMSGWQVAEDNPSKSVPLYQDAGKNQLIRFDGKTFPQP